METKPMTSAPSFALTYLHIRELRGLRSLTLPEDGLVWEGRFPPLTVLAGANGSGKTTLLRCITQAAMMLVSEPGEIPTEVDASECRMDFLVSDGTGAACSLRFIVGDKAFLNAQISDHFWGCVRVPGKPQSPRVGFVTVLRKAVGRQESFVASSWPRIVFLPSEDRDLVVPNTQYMSPGKLEDTAGFVASWKRPTGWQGSTLELLFSARWADLNAKEEGHPDEATNFDTYAKAFADLNGGRKRLAWTRKGDLVVELEGGTTHPIQDLSSGERQALLLLAELRRRWRPGSLVLIDELELHLHDAWQGQLLDVLRAMQTELGGQVIVTTQSHSLFEMAPLGTRAILGRGGLR